MSAGETLDDLLHELRACRVCRDAPRYLPPMPHQPRPVIQAGATARLCIASQAPGTRVHASGRPFTDASGNRLRDWLGLDSETFYDPARVAIVPMGHCFPGQDAKGGDLPPRRECAPIWRERVFAALPRLPRRAALFAADAASAEAGDPGGRDRTALHRKPGAGHPRACQRQAVHRRFR